VSVEVRALEPGDWDALAALFGPRGACAGCWCMAWRVPQKQWEAQRGAGNRRTFRGLVKRGRATGVLAFSDGEAVAWCSVGPRADFAALATKRSLATDWDEHTWSVTCFFVHRDWRERGLGARLLKVAVELARSRGATRVEGYPAPTPRDGSALPAAFAWTGLARVFERSGFEPLAATPGKRPIYVRRLRAAPRR